MSTYKTIAESNNFIVLDNYSKFYEVNDAPAVYQTETAPFGGNGVDQGKEITPVGRNDDRPLLKRGRVGGEAAHSTPVLQKDPGHSERSEEPLSQRDPGHSERSEESLYLRDLGKFEQSEDQSKEIPPVGRNDNRAITKRGIVGGFAAHNPPVP